MTAIKLHLCGLARAKQLLNTKIAAIKKDEEIKRMLSFVVVLAVIIVIPMIIFTLCQYCYYHKRYHYHFHEFYRPQL